MAILSASELLDTREAEEAGVASIAAADAERAIAVAEATLNKALGYKVANDATTLTLGASESETLLLPQRVQTIASITDADVGGSPATVTDDYEIRQTGFSVWRRSGWRNNSTVVITGTFGYATTDDEYILAQQFVILAAVRYLQRTSTSNAMPTPSGGFLTGFSSEGADFTFFTPTGDTTGYHDLDVLIEQIGRHPNRKSGLYTISTTRGTRDLTFDDIVAGREGVEHL